MDIIIPFWPGPSCVIVIFDVVDKVKETWVRPAVQLKALLKATMPEPPLVSTQLFGKLI